MPLKQLNCVIKGDITRVEDPLHRSASEDVFVVQDELHFLPHIAEEVISVVLAQINGAVEPIGAENSHGEMQNPTFLTGGIGMESVDEGGAVVPFEVV